MMLKKTLLAAAVFAMGGVAITAQAATDTTQFTVKIHIDNVCDVHTAPNGASDLDFGSHLSSATNIDNTSTISLLCTPGATYNIGLTAASGAVASRSMTDGTNTVGYELYRDSGRTLAWGDTVNTDTLAGTGTGSLESKTVYGRVPSANKPAGDYADNVTVTVTY